VSDTQRVRTWREIAEEASREQDPQRLLELTKELVLALTEREKRSHCQEEEVPEAQANAQGPG
jgi:hypothetical protein